MNILRLLPLLGVAATTARAVYAPIPPAEQGKTLLVTVGAAAYHDSNIFGARTDEIDSMVYSLTPSVRLQANPTPQTYVSAGYDLTLDYFDDRPGDDLVDSHRLRGRVAHTFSERTTLDVADLFLLSANPEALLAGVPVNRDQSFKLNQFDVRAATAVSRRTAITGKYRHTLLRYDDDGLAESLDRDEQLFGLGATYDFLPEVKGVAEYRYLDIAYRTAGAVKDKQSHFLLAGLDYDASARLTLGGRLGVEDRSRDGGDDTTAPFVELTARYTYAAGSFVSGGYIYTLEEPSDTFAYTDTRVNRFFVNVQHALGARLTASAGVTYDPAELQGRAGFAPDRDETTLRAGAALTWQPVHNLALSATIDRDDVDSDDPGRGYERTRVGVAARVAF